MPPAAVRAHENLLALVRLDENYLARFPDQLSGGERQRIGIARALAAQPDIVLMDEPFSALDPPTRDALGHETIANCTRQLALTSVMVTHDMLEALLLADRIAVMREGRLIADDKPAALDARRRRVRARPDADAAPPCRTAQRIPAGARR